MRQLQALAIVVMAASCGLTDPFLTAPQLAASSSQHTPPAPPPVVLATFSPAPAWTTSVSLTVTDCNGIVAVLVNEGAQPGSSSTGWQLCTTAVGGTSAALAPGGGLHNLHVWAVDEFGNVSTAFTLVDVVVGSMFALGDGHTCALIAGAVYCWGENTYGQLGVGESSSSAGGPGLVVGLSQGVEEIAAAPHARHTCALKTDASVVCWGADDFGQTGNMAETTCMSGSTSTPCATAPEPVLDVNGVPLAQVATIRSGTNFACVIDDTDEQVLCWGDTSDGESGNGTFSTIAMPVLQPRATVVANLAGQIDALALGVQTLAVTTANGNIGWGMDYVTYTDYGIQSSLIGGTTAKTCLAENNICYARPTVMSIADARSSVQLAIGYYHACGLQNDGSVDCWGLNTAGQIGDGTTGSTSTGGVAKLSEAADEVTAGAHHNCARNAGTGELLCWGLNDVGELGYHSTDNSFAGTNPDGVSRTPETVPGLKAVRAFSAGRYQTCAEGQGNVYCWGGNATGELGQNVTGMCGTTPCSYSPLAVPGLPAP